MKNKRNGPTVKPKNPWFTGTQLPRTIACGVLFLTAIIPLVMMVADYENSKKAIPKFIVTVVLPSFTYIAANVKFKVWRMAAKQKFAKTQMFLALLILVVACGFSVYLFWSLHNKEVTQQVPVQGFRDDQTLPVKQKYSIEQVVDDVSSWFGSLLAIALATEVLAISTDKSK
jgi:hypothetical protein